MPTDERRFAPVDRIAWSPRLALPLSFWDQGDDSQQTDAARKNEDQELDAINAALAAVIASTPVEAKPVDHAFAPDGRRRADRAPRRVERLRRRFAKEFLKDTDELPTWLPDRIGNALRFIVVSPVRWTSRTLAMVWSGGHATGSVASPGGRLAWHSSHVVRLSLFDYPMAPARKQEAPSTVWRLVTDDSGRASRHPPGDRIRLVIRIPVILHRRRRTGPDTPADPQRGGASKVSRVSTLNLL